MQNGVEELVADWRQGRGVNTGSEADSRTWMEEHSNAWRNGGGRSWAKRRLRLQERSNMLW